MVTKHEERKEAEVTRGEPDEKAEELERMKEEEEALFTSNARKIESEVLNHRPFLIRLANYERT